MLKKGGANSIWVRESSGSDHQLLKRQARLADNEASIAAIGWRDMYTSPEYSVLIVIVYSSDGTMRNLYWFLLFRALVYTENYHLVSHIFHLEPDLIEIHNNTFISKKIRYHNCENTGVCVFNWYKSNIRDWLWKGIVE